MRNALAALILLLTCAGPAYAEHAISSEESAERLIDNSRVLLGRCLHDLRTAACGGWLDRAEADSSRALALAPGSIEPRLNLALALGMKGRRASISEALSQRYASRGKALIQESLNLAPNEPRVYAMLGGWNLEIVRRGGPVGATMMGASAKAGIRAFNKALALSPDNAAIALHYALALLALNPERYGDKARDLLQAASLAAPHDAFEAIAVEEARRIGAVMAAGGAEAAAKLAAATFL